MKVVFLLFVLFQVPNSYSQEYGFVEVSASLNSVYPSRFAVSDISGFGVGVYYSDFEIGVFRPVLGISYDYTKQFVESASGGHFASMNDLTYHFHDVSIPFLARLTFGKRVEVFIEAGIYAAFGRLSTVKATVTTHIPPNLPEVTHPTLSVRPRIPNGGLQLGIGGNFPLAGGTKKITAKIDYKYGLSDYGESISPQRPMYNQYLRFSIGLNFALKE